MGVAVVGGEEFEQGFLKNILVWVSTWMPISQHMDTHTPTVHNQVA